MAERIKDEDKAKVTKSDLVDAIYTETNIEKKTVQKVLDEFFNQVKISLINGNNIELRGFGMFEVKLRKGRENARNPRTGEKVSVPPHYTAVFRVGKELKESLLDLDIDNK